MDDLTIIDLFFARDETAIRETDNKYGKLLFKIAFNILTNNEDSEECVNDSYMGVWNAIPPTRPKFFRAFVCRIVRNLSLKRLDHKLAKKRAMGVVISLSELEEIVEDERCSQYEDNIGELSGLISSFLKKEKTDSRNVFIRRYWFFDSVEEISKRYSFTESKVKNMLYHTRKKLRSYLIESGIDV